MIAAILRVSEEKKEWFDEISYKYLVVLLLQNLFFGLSYFYKFFDIFEILVLSMTSIYLFLFSLSLLRMNKKEIEENNRLFGKLQFNYQAYCLVWVVLIFYLSSSDPLLPISWVNPSFVWISLNMVGVILFYYFSEHINDKISEIFRD